MLIALAKLFTLKKKRLETDEELIIRWADTLIAQSNYKGDIDTSSFLPFDELFHSTVPTEQDRIDWSMDKARQIRNTIRSNIPDPKGDINIITDAISKYRSEVLKHLLNEGYINEPSAVDTTWKLTDKGRLVKELGGNKKYKKHRLRELHILTNQNLINKLLIAATILTAVMPLVVAKIFPTTNIIRVFPHYQPVHSDTAKLHQPFSGETTRKAPIPETTKKSKQLQTMSQAQ